MGDRAVTAIKLRDYQLEAVNAVFDAWGEGLRRPAIVLPTGAGKTVVFSHLVKSWVLSQTGRFYADKTPQTGRRVIILAHRDELVDQAIAKIKAVAPDLSVGKVKAQDNDLDADVMVCSVQTLAVARRLGEVVQWQDIAGEVGLIITDECHHAAAASYKKIYEAFPDALQLGVTATMARGDGVGLGSTWEEVVYSKSILWMISKGYLTDVRTKRVDLKGLDLGGVKASRGDWQAGDLGKALMDAEADTAIARAYKEHAGDRQGIVFTPTVETAHAATLALDQAGIRSEIVHGATPPENRRTIYEGFRTGNVQVLVNCMVLTEGFDMPQAEVAVIARPTQSAPLYTQMVGRVLRPWPGKTEALVLDLAGASDNKLRTLIDLEPGAVQTLEDDESLAEAVVREAEALNRKVPAGSLAFELKVRDVNSFEASHVAWGRTRKGVWFIDCGTAYVFLWPAKEAGLWDVWVAEDRWRPKTWKRTAYRALDIGTAMAWGEAVSEDHAAFSVAKSARWRKSKPSDPQLAEAARLGIDAEGLNRGQVSDALSLAKASYVFDKHVKG